MPKFLHKISIVMAMQQEAQPIIDALSLIENTNIFNSKLPMRCFQKTVGALEVSIITSGNDLRYNVDNIGSEASTLMTYEAINKTHPDLIISAGTAGGFSKHDANIGTLYISEKYFVFHDRHVPIPGFNESATGMYPALNTYQLAEDLDLTSGIISTGSSLKKSNDDLHIVETHNAVAKEMEAAGVAWVAMLFDIPIMAIKSITNILDQNNKSEEEFIKNLSTASHLLHLKIIQTIQYLQNKTIEDLGRTN